LYFALARGEGGTLVPPYDFLHGESPAQFIRSSLAEAEKALSARHGADPADWLLETKPKTWSTLSPMDVPWSSPDEKIVSRPNQKRGSMNAMYVFKNGKVSMCDAAPPGQSGFIAPDGKADPHYRDQQQLYTSFDCKSRPVTDAEIEANTVSRRELTF
jgi:penicillin amidase